MIQETNGLVGSQRTYQGGVPQKYILDDEKRRFFIETYANPSVSIDELAEKLGVSSRVISKWAKQLGISRKGERIWTDDEIKYLRKHFYQQSFEEIALHLNRPVGSVRTKAHRLGLAEFDGYNKNDLILALGVTKERVDKWIRLRWIKCNKSGTSHSDHWRFIDKNIRDFLIAHPEEIDPRKLDPERWIWIVDILASKDGIGRLDQAYELSESQEGKTS